LTDDFVDWRGCNDDVNGFADSAFVGHRQGHGFGDEQGSVR
jgi:hypothetical protein